MNTTEQRLKNRQARDRLQTVRLVVYFMLAAYCGAAIVWLFAGASALHLD